MELETDWVRQRLDAVMVGGWDSRDGRDLLEAVRHAVVLPLVRRHRVAGAAARQAEATGWATAWEVLRRPSARTCQNPAGMVWVAVRRAITEEVLAASRVILLSPLDDGRGDHALDLLWAPAAGTGPRSELGECLGPLGAALVRQGWTSCLLEEAITLLAETAVHRHGLPGARWRWLSIQLGMPEWQARRLAGLLVGGKGAPGLLALMVRHGCRVLEDPDAVAAMQSTVRRTCAPPWHHLAVTEARWLDAGSRMGPPR